MAALDADRLMVRLAWPDGHSTGRHASAGQTPHRPLTKPFTHTRYEEDLFSIGELDDWEEDELGFDIEEDELITDQG